MSAWRTAVARLRGLWRRDVIADEIREEMQSHLDMRAQDLEARGLSPAEARRAAARAFGNLSRLRDEGYDVRGGGALERLVQDLRYGVRALWQAPMFTLVALSVLALAIGAGTTVYSIVDAAALRPLPFPEPHRLAAVLGVDAPTARFSAGGRTTISTFLDWRRMQRSFDAIAMTWRTSLPTRTAAGEPTDVRAEQVSWEFFSVLQAAPSRGRPFTASDELEGRHHVVILSDRFWRELGGAPDVIGTPLDVDGEPWEIVGVMPPAVEYPAGDPQPTDVYVPLPLRAADYARRAGHTYNWIVIGRLKDGVSVAQADADMKRVAGTLDALYPAWEPGRTARVVPLREHVVGDARAWLLMLLGAIGFVLLIACANVANLMLARATVRQRELAVRAALGAGRGRLLRAILLEGLILSAGAAMLGTGLAWGGVSLLARWLPAAVPRAAAIAVNGRVLAAEATAAILIGLVMSLAPGRHLGRVSLVDALRVGLRGTAADRGTSRMRRGLVAVEVAVAFTLLVGAGLFVTSFRNLMAIDLGFDYHHVLFLNGLGPRFDPGGHDRSRWTWRPTDAPQARRALAAQYFAELASAVARVPGVVALAVNDGGLPIEGSWSSRRVSLPDQPDRPGLPDIDRIRVTPGYFDALKLPLRRGRILSAEDRLGAPLVAVVSELAARTYWPDRDPIGQQVRIEKSSADDLPGPFEIVGVVDDTRHRGPEEPIRPQMYVTLAQDSSQYARLVIRTAGDPLLVLPSVKAAVWSVNPNQHLTQPTYTLEGALDRLIAQRRFNMAALSVFGGVALVIAAAGIFGVMAYTVGRRTPEIGLRVSLGATPSRVVWLVLGDASLLVVLGLLAGGVAAVSLARLVDGMLFGMTALDAPTFIGTAATLVAVGLFAAALPARRAARIDPIRALRQD